MDEQGLILDVTPNGQDDRAFLEKLGHPVLVCHGPDMGHLCPLLKGSCDMIDAAHGVVFQLDLERPQHRAILKRYQEVLPDDVPIAVVLQEGQQEKYRELLSGIQTWEDEPTVSELDGFAAEVEAADWTRE